jgi:glycosyltransferase involved in cell wall biosynthesis
MKLTFVTPRFGKEIVGGAEYAIAQLAANCVRYGDVEAEILTTTAGDERTWSKKYEEGSEFIDGIKIQRFANEPIDRNEFDSWGSQFFSRLEKMTDQDFDQWLIRQGPYSPDLLDAIENCTSDAVIFHPMLSSPTSHGLLRAKVPTVLHPALHDEPVSRMSGYKKVVNSSSLLCFSTFFEQNLCNELYQSQLVKQSVLGFGIEDIVRSSPHEESEILNKYNLEKETYVVVLGRVDAGKGSDLVAKFFEQYSKTNPEVKLVFVGPISQNSLLNDSIFVEKNENIITIGLVSDTDRDVLVTNSLALINPSVTESFSLVMLEAMKSKIPVIINQACGPTLEHVNRSNSGYMFNDFASFCASIQLASEDSADRDLRIENGYKYVVDNYSWENIISKYVNLIMSLP